jgi:hypothetical protein
MKKQPQWAQLQLARIIGLVLTYLVYRKLGVPRPMAIGMIGAEVRIESRRG